MRKALLPLSFLLFLMPLERPAAAVQGTSFAIVNVTGSLSEPIGVTNAGDDSGRLFIIERPGRIRIFRNGQLLTNPFLNITTTVGCGTGCGERGLLGLAFHPQYETNGFFYVFYTRTDGTLVVARYQVSAANPDAANTGSAAVLLTIPHPRGNHNGGHLAFGPDGFLYIATGDGGDGGDPDENGQNINTLLGKILRIDVNGDDFPSDPNRNYAIPGGNPFAGSTPGADEVWAYGLRNPWHFSFDRLGGDLYIGDVGQGLWEEVNLQPAASPGGVNYGWDCREGAHDYNDTNGDRNANCGPVVSTDPFFEYSHSFGCSVTGGNVSRNLPQHAWYGDYLFGDFCSGRIWISGLSGAGARSTAELIDTAFGISGFGESESGRIYLTDLSGNTLQWLAPYTFTDVPPAYWAWSPVEALNTQGVTTGCDTPTQFCPERLLTRAEMAVFLVRSLRGGSFVPPPATGTFADVPPSYWAASFIEQLFRDGVTSGCATSPSRYCPDQLVSRWEMAIFLLRARHGGSYTPPPATGTVFADVPASHWAAAWIEQLYAEGLTTGCASSPLRYCPGGTLSRAEMAAFLARTFNWALP